MIEIVFKFPGGKVGRGYRWPAAPRVGDLVTIPREITLEDWAYKVTGVNWTPAPGSGGVLAVITLAE